MLKSFWRPSKNLRRAPGLSGKASDSSNVDPRRYDQLTEAENAFIGHLMAPSNHITDMAFGHLIVAHVETFHILLGERVEDFCDFSLSLAG